MVMKFNWGEKKKNDWERSGRWIRGLDIEPDGRYGTTPSVLLRM